MELQASPTSFGDREHFMDVLRGFAILGIFIANIGAGFAFYDSENPGTGMWFAPPWDAQFEFAHSWFIDGKFYSIFSLLFGWGLALQWNRPANVLGSTRLIKRRLMFMFILGMAHLVLVWPGDIVAFYALVGFLLLLVFKWSSKRLVIAGVICILLPILLYFLKMKVEIFNAPAGLLFMTGGMIGEKISGVNSQETFEAALHGHSWFDLIKLNVAGFFFRFGDLFFQSRIFKVLGMFMIGFAVGKTEFFKKCVAQPTMLWRMASMGLLIGLPLNFMLANFSVDDYYQLKIDGWYKTIVYALGVVPLALAYVAILALIFNATIGRRVLMILAPVGKMAFTNYVMHSVINTLVFFGVGFNLMGKVGPMWWTIFACVVFCFQIIVSTLWLKLFEFGPLEWFWRSLTYGRWQPFKKVVI